MSADFVITRELPEIEYDDAVNQVSEQLGAEGFENIGREQLFAQALEEHRVAEEVSHSDAAVDGKDHSSELHAARQLGHQRSPVGPDLFAQLCVLDRPTVGLGPVLRAVSQVLAGHLGPNPPL